MERLGREGAEAHWFLIGKLANRSALIGATRCLSVVSSVS